VISNPEHWRFWVALTLLGIVTSGAVLLLTDSPGLSGLVASGLAIALSICRLRQERSGNSSQSGSAKI